MKHSRRGCNGSAANCLLPACPAHARVPWHVLAVLNCHHYKLALSPACPAPRRSVGPFLGAIASVPLHLFFASKWFEGGSSHDPLALAGSASHSSKGGGGDTTRQASPGILGSVCSVAHMWHACRSVRLRGAATASAICFLLLSGMALHLRHSQPVCCCRALVEWPAAAAVEWPAAAVTALRIPLASTLRRWCEQV